MYEYSFRVRYSETDRTGRLSLPGLLAILQDCGYFHGEDRGQGLEFARREKQTWFLVSWQIYVKKMPSVSEYCTVSTWFYEVRGPLAFTNILLRDARGEVLAEGEVVWVYMDLEKGRPMRPPMDSYPPEDRGERWEMEYAPRKIFLPEGAERGLPILVDAEQVDTNDHVNNFRYMQLAFRAAGFPEGCRGFRAEYVKQAYLGEFLTPVVAKVPGEITVSLEDHTGDPCAKFLFLL